MSGRGFSVAAYLTASQPRYLAKFANVVRPLRVPRVASGVLNRGGYSESREKAHNSCVYANYQGIGRDYSSSPFSGT